MNLTIPQALGVYPFSEAKLIAGGNGINRSITAVNIMDAPDIHNWVKEGELLLTTAFIIKDNINNAVEMVSQLHQKKCAGLAIKLGRYWSEIPDKLIDIANKLQFPIFKLPYSYTFSDQIKALYDAAHLQKENWLKEKLVYQKELITFSHDEKNLDQYLNIVSKFIHHPFAIITNQADVLYNQTNTNETELIQNWYGLERSTKVKSKDNIYYQIELQNEREKYGYLFIMIHSQSAITKEEELLFFQIGDILTDYLAKKKLSNPKQLLDQTFSVLMQRLLNNEITTDYLREQLKGENKALLSLPYWVIMTSDKLKMNQMNFQHIQKEIENHPYLQNYDTKHVIFKGKMITMLFDSNQDKTHYHKTNQFIIPLQEVLQASNMKHQISMTISKKKEKIEALYDSYKECLQAKQTADVMDYEDPVIMCENLDFISLFHHIPGHLSDSFYQNTLEAFLNQDTTYEKDMLTTLETYIECNGNIKEVASKLFVHRNTVVYRLEKVSTLLNIDLKNINDLLRIKMALVFQQIKNIR
ncbi:PucR family transcriptional regulator [Gracilibacillus sp. YIM 98692]|uniref:PucR family transcriptional regulator n=1 Tax=Gracilibacillus sp. YIM 98692 TaxID=2663532 RepID=UPI0013D78229|nr:PucR family transcriptional regulator [Gracilibacillus sp. YIM 98692]